jgi:hypothetical protein
MIARHHNGVIDERAFSVSWIFPFLSNGIEMMFSVVSPSISSVPSYKTAGARLLYRMLRYGMKYVDQGAGFYEAQHRKQQVTRLQRKTAQLGLKIIEVAAAALKLRPRVSHGSSWSET